MKVVIYARVSTEEQTADNQLPALNQWISNRGHTLVATYTENVSAWKAGHQKELARLFTELPRTGARICLVWALDRLTREGPLNQLTLIDRFKRSGVKLISIQETWTEAPGELEELLHTIVAWVSRSSSQRNSERQKASIAHRKELGLPVGRPKGAKDKKKRRKLGYLLRNHPELRK